MRELERDLRVLGRLRAPEGFEGRVLAAAGGSDRYATLSTPIGDFWIAWRGDRLLGALRTEGSPRFERWYLARLGGRATREPALPEDLARRLRGALAGEARGGLRFDLERLTEFEQAVLRKALEIPYGEVRSYAWVAREIGHVRAVRAVGTALARNPIPLFIPCHRVVRSDGAVGDYGAGGPDAKRAMLQHEGMDLTVLDGLGRRRVRYLGSTTTRIFCVPSCHQARRITDAHLVTFHDEAEAARAGYRPCARCRPVAA